MWDLLPSHPGTQAEPDARLSFPAGARARARPQGGVGDFSQCLLHLLLRSVVAWGKLLSVNLVTFEQICGAAAPNPWALGCSYLVACGQPGPAPGIELE